LYDVLGGLILASTDTCVAWRGFALRELRARQHSGYIVMEVSCGIHTEQLVLQALAKLALMQSCAIVAAAHS
jgi:hypothetical protein